MKAFVNLYIASVKEFVRSRMTVFWTLVFPILFILMFGAIFSGGGTTQFNVGLVVEDQGQTGATLASVFKQIPVFQISQGPRDDELAALRKGDRRAVIVLPASLSQAVQARQATPVEVYYDPAQQQASQIVLGVVRQVLGEMERRMTGAPTLLVIDEKTVQSQRLRNIDFMVPGILAMALMQLGLFGTAQPVVQLREQGVLRRLSATPLPRMTVLASQIAHRLTIGLVQTVLILALGMVVFKVPMVGSWLGLLGFVMLGAMMFVALGYVIAAFSSSQESAAGISSVLNFPMMFLSGLFFPPEIMPSFLMPITKIIPVTYLADALRQLMLGANPLNPQLINVGVLAAWLLVCLVLSVRFFKWDNAT